MVEFPKCYCGMWGGVNLICRSHLYKKLIRVTKLRMKDSMGLLSKKESIEHEFLEDALRDVDIQRIVKEKHD